MKRSASDDEAIEKAEKVVVPHDPVNEQVVISMALAEVEARNSLVVRLTPDQFIAPAHHVIWACVREAQHRQLGCEPATLQQIARQLGLDLDVRYVAELAESKPPTNSLSYHVDCLLWDYTRVTAAAGPVAELLHALRTPTSQPERVRGLARAVGASLDGAGDRAYLLDPEALVRDQVAEMKLRRTGQATWPFGIPGLDILEDGHTPRLVPGAAPGMVTVVTGCSGSGKSPMLVNMVLGLARQRRKVLYGAWEVRGGMTLEWLAIIALGYDRAAIQVGQFDDEQLAAIEKMMLRISRYVRFMANPFRRSREVNTKRRSGGNDRNLDVVHGYVADSGCDVFVADLWERCLVDSAPDEEKAALFRMQAMMEEQRCHGILVAQQRLKDIEQRPDKRPTREGIKGSSAWVEVADNIFGTHRPALWKRVPDTVLNLIILKQRYGKWPSMLAFDWSPLHYSITNGREVPYDTVGEAEAEGGDTPFDAPAPRKGGRRPYGGGRPRGEG